MALACWCQSDLTKRKSLIKAIYTALFVDGAEMTLDVLAAIAGNFDVTEESILDALDGGPVAQLHENAVAAALDAGVFGVPSFVCESEVFWGNDRLVLLREHLLNSKRTP
jgi:2-hydroxychromene-2-carboxylate isomerase